MNKGSKTQYAVLGALSIQPMSGYEMKKMMNESTNYFWSESNGQIYPTLAKLAKEKYITVENQLVGSKPKKVYSLSATGVARLKKWLLEDPEYYPARNELVLKLFYGQNVSPKISIGHINKHSERCKQALIVYQDIIDSLEVLVRKKQRPVYFLIAALAGIKAVEAEIEWCNESIKLISKYTK
jgi:DNA-binding PadR family transcriptional regulator